MTIPIERSRAIRQTREFLRALLDPKRTPRVPSKIRQEAYWCLRHFPSDLDINLEVVEGGRFEELAYEQKD